MCFQLIAVWLSFVIFLPDKLGNILEKILKSKKNMPKIIIKESIMIGAPRGELISNESFKISPILKALIERLLKYKKDIKKAKSEGINRK